jgi:hypothetical protein
MGEFKIRCTKTRDRRFIAGKVYSMGKYGLLTDEFGNPCSDEFTGDFERWYRNCNWRDYAFEPAKDLRTVVIHTDGETTTAILKDGKTVLKRATAKCSPEDTFDFGVGARLTFDRLMAEDKPIPTYYNGKVICVDNCGNPGKYIIGKVYAIKDGQMCGENGVPCPDTPVKSFAEWAKYSASMFIEYKGGLE